MPTVTMQIKDVLKRDPNEPIEEIIKLNQLDEQTVYQELTEYVATDRIREQYRTLLKAIADAPSEPTEDVGVWISGFFGSGKSSFAKNLGYVLGNRSVLGRRAADLFKQVMDDEKISQWVDYINQRIPTEVIMFDVSVDQAVRKNTERLAEIMYTVLLRELDYAQDYDIAELEMELEREGTLDTFMARCQTMGFGDWRTVRIGAQRMSRASAILHEMDPAHYPAADSWARSLGAKTADISVGKFVDRTFELMARRRPGKALTFIIDEVGQYVAQSVTKIEDLRAVVEQFGKESKNRVKQRQAIAPVWIIVTSQEKLDEVVAAIDSRRIELAKVQERFSQRIDLAPADIREVATKRVLSKRESAIPRLNQLYTANQGQLLTACHLEHTSRHSEVRERDFVQCYPYLPHYIDLSIDIVSGIRLQPGAPRQLGGSNRTIIKQAHEMLVSDQTHLETAPVGRLVTLDLIFDLVEGNLSSERRKDLSDIVERFAGDAHDHGWAARVAKAICLLEYVRDLPRTEANLAAMLVDTVGQPAPVPQVKAALERLERAQFIRFTDEGYKLQTAQEKRWDTERKSYLAPKPKDRNDIKREALGDLFTDPRLKAYRYRDLRTFRVGIAVDGVREGDEGQIPLSLLVAEDMVPSDPESFSSKLNSAVNDSRSAQHQNELYWVFTLTSDIDDLINNLYASRQMIGKYSQVSAQGQLMADYVTLLEAEKREEARLRDRLREKVSTALSAGQGVFRGVTKDASELGRTPSEIFKSFFEYAVPSLYPKLDMGARRLSGDEAEEFLKAANLNALPQVFYSGDQGLDLVVKEGGKYVPNPSAPIAEEVLGYLKSENAYGNKITGRGLAERFQGIGYGWDLDTLRLVLAALLRAGAIEVVYQGRRYRNYQDPQCRVPFTSTPAFRQAAFVPRESIGLKALTTAVEQFEALTGEEVDVDEGAIAEALKKLANDEMRLLLPLSAEVRAHGLPAVDLLQDYEQMLTGIQAAAADDCVRTLAGDGRAFAETREQVRKIRESVTDANLRMIRRARAVAETMWPALASRGLAQNVAQDVAQDVAEQVERLRALLSDELFYTNIPQITRLAQAISAVYTAEYRRVHHARFDTYSRAIDDIKGRPEWPMLPQTAYAATLAPLVSRACQEEADLSDGGLSCQRCNATLSQMDSDCAAVTALTSQVIANLHAATLPPPTAGPAEAPVVRVRVADVVGDALDTEESVEIAVQRLRDQLLTLIARGARIILE